MKDFWTELNIVKRELRKKSKNISQLKSTYKVRAVSINYEKSRSFSDYNNFFDENKNKDSKKKTFFFYDLKLKTKLYRIYLFHALFLRVMLKLIFRSLERTLPTRSLRYRISF
jgi:hypothetical protein